MIVKGLELPAAFADLVPAIRQDGTPLFVTIGKFDAYGHHFDAPLQLFTRMQDLDGWDDEAFSGFGVTEFEPGELEEANADAEGDPGGIPYITDFSRIVCFDLGKVDYPFCLDFRDNLQEPSVIFLDDSYWRRVAPNFKEFMRLYRPSRESNAVSEQMTGISPEDRDVIARTEEALAQTVFQGEPPRQISLPVTGAKFGAMDWDQIRTASRIEDVKANVKRLAALGHEELAQAVKTVMEAVAQSDQLTAKQRFDKLAQLDAVSRQAILPPAKEP
jgi:hypothetical protein